VPVEITDEVKMGAKSRVMQHAPGIAANRENASSRNIVVLVEDEAVMVLGYAAAIDHRMAIVLAGTFEHGLSPAWFMRGLHPPVHLSMSAGV
jgi:hypothetical protein